jgi:hypothetical protein
LTDPQEVFVPILDDHHDGKHPVETDGAWSESYYFNAYDPGVDTGFFSRIGIRPNEGTIDASLSVWLPNGDVAHLRAERPQHEMIDAHLEVGPITYECVSSMREWRLRGRGSAWVQHLSPLPDTSRGQRVMSDLDVDVTFHALTPAIGVDGQGRDKSGAAGVAKASVGKGHLEQAGRWTGSIAVDGTAYPFGDARGNRDKSWGPRRWGGPRMWRWFSINIGDDVAFGGIRIDTEVGNLHRGWVWRDGTATSVQEWQVRTELADDDLTQRVVHLTVRDKAGRSHELRGDLLRVAPLSRTGAPGGTLVNEGLTRWTYEGRTGTGIAEYLHQLDANGRPLTPIE